MVLERVRSDFPSSASAFRPKLECYNGLILRLVLEGKINKLFFIIMILIISSTQLSLYLYTTANWQSANAANNSISAVESLS